MIYYYCLLWPIGLPIGLALGCWCHSIYVRIDISILYNQSIVPCVDFITLATCLECPKQGPGVSWEMSGRTGAYWFQERITGPIGSIK